MSESRSALARRVVLKGLAAGMVYSLAWVLSNHWFFHAWNKHYLGVFIIEFSASLLSWFILKSSIQDIWGKAFCIAAVFSFFGCFLLLTVYSPPLNRFLFAWHPSTDTLGEYSSKGIEMICLFSLGSKVLTCLFAAHFFCKEH